MSLYFSTDVEEDSEEDGVEQEEDLEDEESEEDEDDEEVAILASESETLNNFCPSRFSQVCLDFPFLQNANLYRNCV